MNSNEYRILNILLSSEIKSRDELAGILGISKRSVQYAVSCLNTELKSHGGYIISKTGAGNGYKLEIKDLNKLNDYLQSVKDAENMMLMERIDRIKFIIMLFLSRNSYLRVEDIGDRLHISERQVSKDLKGVKEKLLLYNINIRSVPYYGMVLYHWDLPQVLQDRGGWTNRECVGWFEYYAETMYKELGDLVDNWITMVEPNVICFSGH